MTDTSFLIPVVHVVYCVLMFAMFPIMRLPLRKDKNVDI